MFLRVYARTYIYAYAMRRRIPGQHQRHTQRHTQRTRPAAPAAGQRHHPDGGTDHATGSKTPYPWPGFENVLQNVFDLSPNRTSTAASTGSHSTTAPRAGPDPVPAGRHQGPQHRQQGTGPRAADPQHRTQRHPSRGTGQQPIEATPPYNPSPPWGEGGTYYDELL